MFYLLAKVSEVNHKLDIMNHEMKESVFILQHKKAIFLVEYSSGRIKINQTSKDGNQHACGSLISVNDIYYFATNLHVVFDFDTNKVRKIAFVPLNHKNYLGQQIIAIISNK